jgi:hypothetical protein
MVEIGTGNFLPAPHRNLDQLGELSLRETQFGVLAERASSRKLNCSGKLAHPDRRYRSYPARCSGQDRAAGRAVFLTES